MICNKKTTHFVEFSMNKLVLWDEAAALFRVDVKV